MIWFWGTGGAGMRLTDRFTALLADAFGPARVSLSCHAENAFLAVVRMRGHPTTTVGGAAGHASRAALALDSPRRLRVLWRHLRKHRPDLVLIPMNFAFAWPFALLPRCLGLQVAYMVHDVQPHPGDYAPKWQAATQRRLVAVSQRLLAPSAWTAGEIETRYPSAPPTGVVSLAALTPRRRAEPRLLSEGPVHFLFLGRLMAYKGLQVLAEALAGLRDRTDWRLTIAGTGPEGDSVRRAFGGMAQVDLSRLEYVAEGEIDTLIATHDVLLCPYLEASQSGVVAEAQADGMPSLVTRVGALPEQIGQGRAGWIATAATAEALRTAIAGLLDDRTDYPAKSRAALDIAGDCTGSALAGLLAGR